VTYANGGNQTVISFSILNASDQPVEVVPPQIQDQRSRVKKKKRREGKSLTADQLQIREYRLSTTRIEAGARADGVVVFDRPNFKTIDGEALPSDSAG